MMFKLFMLLIFIPMYVSAASDNCSTRYVGGGSTPDAALEDLPPLDQGDFGICYAYSATFMYDYWKRSHGSGDQGRSSPIEAALGAATGTDYTTGYSHRAGRPKDDHQFNFEDLASGDAQNPMVYLLKNGRCNNDTLGNFSNLDGINHAEEELRQFYYDFQEFRAAYTGYVNFSSVPGSTWHQAGLVGERIRRCFHEVLHLPLDTLPAADVIATLLHDKNPTKLMHELIYAQCRENRNVIPELNRPRMVSYEAQDYWKIAMPPVSIYKSAINHVLERSGAASQPIEISFCSSVFRTSYSQPIEREDIDYHINPSARGNCVPHSAVIVARENRGGVCKYLIQNHSGTECNDHYAPGVECVDGRMWVPADSLMNATYGFSHLQDRSWPEYFTGTYRN